VAVTGLLYFHLYAAVIWIVRQKDKKRLTSIEMRFFRRTTGYTPFDHERNEEISEQFKAVPVDEKLRRYKSHCLQHVKRMNNNSMTRILLNYRPNDEDDLEYL
jgi:hypothetical protein